MENMPNNKNKKEGWEERFKEIGHCIRTDNPYNFRFVKNFINDELQAQKNEIIEMISGRLGRFEDSMDVSSVGENGTIHTSDYKKGYRDAIFELLKKFPKAIEKLK